MKKVGAVILAAGASTRLGKPKQLVMIYRENLLERTVRVAIESGCSPVVVVLGASAELIQQSSNLRGALVALNAEWSEGMAGSIKVGVSALTDVAGAVVMTCDMPAVSANHLRSLAATDQIREAPMRDEVEYPLISRSRSFRS